MLLERLEAQSAADSDEAHKIGGNEDRRGEHTRIQQDHEEKKDVVRRKRHFIVNVHKTKEDYLYFQLSRGGEAVEPKTPDPDEAWSKRQWEKAMRTWRIQLRQWGRHAGSEEEGFDEANIE